MATFPATNFTTRIEQPRRLLIARLLWGAFFLLTVGVLIWAYSTYIPWMEMFRTFAGDMFALAQRSHKAGNRFLLTVEGVQMTLFLVIGVLLAWFRSDDWLALFISGLLIAWGFSEGFSTFDGNPVAETTIADVYLIMTSIAFVSVLVLFPDGRVRPRWTLFIILLEGVSWVLQWVFFQLESIGNVAVSLTLSIPTFLALGVFIYKYRSSMTPAERQQSKWFVLGLVLAWAGGQLPIVFNTIIDTQGATVAARFFIVAYPIENLLAVLPAVGLTIAVTRYRLWDINFIINRTLVYGLLLILLIAILVGGFFGLEALLGSALGDAQPILSAGLAGSAAVALSTPARNGLRRFVDRRLYGIELDYVEVLKQYGSQARSVRSEAGTTAIGNYVNLELIGKGGMGEIYRGQHPTLNQAVAIKRVPLNQPLDDELRKRFMREAQAISQLEHPNIVAFHEVGDHQGYPYMVMEFIDGTDLAQMLTAQGAFQLEDALPILTDIARALDFAHAGDVIHRDIKPSNIMIETTSSDWRAVLMDFGIAKIIAAETRLTGTGNMIGTLSYVAPEQLQGLPSIDGRADVYSLAVLAYEMLTGQLPFKKANPGAMVLAHLMEPPPDACLLLPGLPTACGQVLQQGMAKRPEDRFPTAGALIAALEIS